MNKFLLSTLVALLTLPIQAEWEPRGMCYVWTGSEKPGTPDDMLQGEVYDYNRSPEGDFFTYSGVYGESGSRKNNHKTALKAKNSGAVNPTGSPDVHGQFAYTLKMLMQGKDNILSKYYKYPFTIATPHIYMAPISFKSLADELKGAEEESDFLSEADASQKKTGKAKSYSDHISWFAIFRGAVIAPRSMKFRFYGAADDAIAVRFNNKLVLETGFFKPALYEGNGMKDKGCDWSYTKKYQKEVAEGLHADKEDYVVRKLKSTPFCNDAFNGVTGGTPIEVEEGKTYPIEIIIGNNGGHTLFYLLTQEVTPGNNAPLQLFRTNASEPSLPISFKGYSSTHYGEQGPDFAEDSPIWKIGKAPAIRKKKKKKK